MPVTDRARDPTPRPQHLDLTAYQPHQQRPRGPKKRVRFSDPGPTTQFESESSGLTPFIRRTTLSTPTSNRRHSTPATLWNRSPLQTPSPSGIIQFESLKVQILEDRVIRRLRRRGLSEELIKVEWDKKHAAKNREREVERLRNELEERDSDMLKLREELDLANQLGGDLAALNVKFQEYEQQIAELKAALQEKVSETEGDPDWTLAARDPFNFDDEGDLMITKYDQDFRESMMDDELITTPTRLQTSFPSPPSTIPNTPSRRVVSTSSAGIQASLPVPDPEKDALKTQLESLQSEISKLTSKLALHDDNQSRLSGKLSEFLPTDASYDHSTLDSALDSVLTQLALAQSHAVEQSTAFSALGSDITNLGFSPGSSPHRILADIAAQFHQARLELEYITPGEQAEGFENEKLLEMLVSRIRILNQRTKESDDKIDQYHEQEVSLRQQLSTRIDALQDVQGDLSLARSIIEELKQEVSDKELGNKRLQAALKTYRDEVRGMEKLVERMDKEKSQAEGMMKNKMKEVENKLQTEILRHDSTNADAEGKNMLLAELERRLNAALQAQEEIEKQMAALVAEKDAAIQKLERSGTDREKAHGDALALRDARVSELREEIERLNEALKAAYSNTLTLGGENRRLKNQVEDVKISGQAMLQDAHAQMARMREQISSILQTGVESTSTQASTSAFGQDEMDGSPAGGSLLESQPVVRRGRYFDAALARRRSSRVKRRKYDSGLGFLEEEEEENDGDTNMEAVEA